MLKRSLPASGFAAPMVKPLSTHLLSIQVAAPPVAPLGVVRVVGLVGEEAFFPWISWTCLGLDTATDWETDTVTWQCDRVKEREEKAVSTGELDARDQQGITEQPVTGGKDGLLIVKPSTLTTDCFWLKKGKEQRESKGIMNVDLAPWKTLLQSHFIFRYFGLAESLLGALLGAQGGLIFPPYGPTRWISNALNLWQ